MTVIVPAYIWDILQLIMILYSAIAHAHHIEMIITSARRLQISCEIRGFQYFSYDNTVTMNNYNSVCVWPSREIGYSSCSLYGNMHILP